MKRIEIKKQTGIKKFLRDTAAISPVIATLILLVIAAVAAAGVGILTQKAQDNANSQTVKKDLSVIGTIKLGGASLLQAVSLGEVEGISKVYPGLTINVGAGTGNSGRAQLYNKEIDIAASAEIWPDTASSKFKNPDPLTGLEYKGREYAVIQGGDPDAWVYEQKIGTGFIVPVANSKNIAVLKITNTSSVYTKSNGTLELNYSTLAYAYSGISNTANDTGASLTNGKLTINNPDSITLTLVQRGDKGSTHQAIFSQWIYPGTSATVLDTNIDNASLSPIKKFNSVPDIFTYIRNTADTLGFIPWNPEASYASGIVAAQLNNGAGWITAEDKNKGIGGAYDAASKKYDSGKGLASDAYYYVAGVPKGPTKAFLDFVLSADGQKILHENGWFSQ